jgi:CubicO group peptidase (beta-lactamase class C family)
MFLTLGINTLLIAQHKNDLPFFIHSLDSIRVQLKIPGMAVAVLKGDSILVNAGLGYADLEHQIKVTPHTSFRVASVTKTFSSTLLLQLAEQGKINLDSPINHYGIDLGNPAITVRQLLTHTSEGVPGTNFQYNGYRFGLLGPIMEKASGQFFYDLLLDNIIVPLNMYSTAPGISLDEYYQSIHRNNKLRPYFDTAFANLARPYALDADGKVVLSTYQNEFGAFGGMVTTVNDLLKYSKAIDENRFVSAETQRQIFTPNQTTGHKITPYGLGWFVQQYGGFDFYWHYGQTRGESALFVKVPTLKLTLVILCNTIRLSQPFPLGDGDLFTSPAGQLFYHVFVNEQTDRNFQNNEMVANATLALASGDTSKAMNIYERYAQLNFIARKKTTGKIIAGIQDAAINTDLSRKFKLTKETKVRIYGTGENCSADFSSWCDYGWIENSKGKTIWQMQGQHAVSAGGAVKNQHVEQVITLSPGDYILRYKSDGGHAFGNWDSLPPDDFFWGIVLYHTAN